MNPLMLRNLQVYTLEARLWILCTWSIPYVFFAATPPQTALTSSKTHYVLFSDPNTVREVELICPIKPGVLSDKYTVQWLQSSPTFSTLIGETDYTVTVEESGSETFPLIPTGYQCEVNIQHNSDEDESYKSSEIVVEKRG